MTDADTIAKLGKQLGAPYVMAGSITALGGQKLPVVTIVKIETVQQVAGDYLTYTSEKELADKVSGMARNLLTMLDVDISGMEKRAVLPVQLENDIGHGLDADTPTQILSIDLMWNKSYAIYPRTGTLEQVQKEVETQNSGVTDYREAAQLGKAENPWPVLSVVARNLRTSNMFNYVQRFHASIIEAEYGTLVDVAGAAPGKFVSQTPGSSSRPSPSTASHLSRLRRRLPRQNLRPVPVLPDVPGSPCPPNIS
jgi:hypothetical protein